MSIKSLSETESRRRGGWVVGGSGGGRDGGVRRGADMIHCRAVVRTTER